MDSKNLPQPLHSILIGIILGDVFLCKSSPTSNTRFEMSFGQNYKEYAESIELLFKDYISTPVKSIELKGKNNSFINYRLKTKSAFNYYHNLFYKHIMIESGIYK